MSIYCVLLGWNENTGKFKWNQIQTKKNKEDKTKKFYTITRIIYSLNQKKTTNKFID